MLLLLVFCHFLADYPLQGDFLAKAKNPVNPIPNIPWYQAMVAHCSIHAGFVFLVTGNFLFAGIEFFVHYLTDTAKCKGRISYNIDQFIHIITKIVIVLLAYRGLLPY
jgi:hypothetical protein